MITRTQGCLFPAALLLSACSADDREARLRAAGPNPSLDALLRVADADVGAGLFGACARCHTISRGGIHKAGPNLHGILGQPIASVPRYGYTAALQQVRGTWTPTKMDAWLSSPQRFAPGNKMAYPGTPDPLDRADLIAYLQSQSD